MTLARRLYKKKPTGGLSMLDIAGCALWLEADQGVSVSSGKATGVDDYSGHSRGCSQSNSSLQPSLVTGALNGHPVLRFDGTQYLVSDTLTGLGGEHYYTMTFVATYSTTAAGSLLSFQNGWGEFANVDIGDTNNAYIQNSDWSVYRALPDHNPHVINVVYNGDLGPWDILQYWVDGVRRAQRTTSSVQTTAPNPTTHYALGARYDGFVIPWPGDIAAVVVHTGLVSGTDRTLINNHYETKYGITGV